MEPDATAWSQTEPYGAVRMEYTEVTGWGKGCEKRWWRGEGRGWV